MEKVFLFDNIPTEFALAKALNEQKVAFPITAEIRQGEMQSSRCSNGSYYPVNESIDAVSLYELNAVLQNGKTDGWLKDMPLTMICEEWPEEDLGPEPSLSAAERNPSMVK